MHLIGFVVAGQCVHDDVDTGAKRHFALDLTSGNGGVEGASTRVQGPGGSEIVGGDKDRCDAVGTACLTRCGGIGYATRFNLKLTAVPAAWKLA